MDKTMLVYRIEDQFNIGPYFGKTDLFTGKLAKIVSNHAFNRPIVNHVLHMWSKKYVCAFSSMTKLKWWFNKTYMKELIKWEENKNVNPHCYKHKISIYAVPSNQVHENSKQLIFKLKNAELLTQIPLLQEKIF